jgi:hypothetical protein
MTKIVLCMSSKFIAWRGSSPQGFVMKNSLVIQFSRHSHGKCTLASDDHVKAILGYQVWVN